MPRHCRTRFVSLIGLPLLGSLAAGCGATGDGLPREPVAGTVTLDGRPLDDGFISFVPADGSETVVSAEINQGRYALPRTEGPVTGVQTVQIFATGPTGRKVKNPENPRELIEETGELLPARYNLRSELRAEIQPGGPHEFDFALSSDRATRLSRR